MPKKQPAGNDIPSKTAKPKTQKQNDPVRAVGIGLRESEWAKLDKIAKQLGETRHSVAVYALHYFLQKWESGEIKTQEKPKLPEL